MKQIISETWLQDCRGLFLRDLEINISIGVYEQEKKKKQKILIDVDVYVPLAKNTPKEDNLEEVFDYDFMRNSVLQYVSHNQIHFNLQETLCDRLAAIMLEHPLVQAVRVSTRKTEVYPDCASVGVETFLMKKWRTI
jgi:7,8-dihydroneopterin aldolase/epimerase/oxygenase